MEHSQEGLRQEQEKVTLPGDRRYRTSKYFLQDQLRCSEAAADFRSVRELVANTASFSFKQAFQFQTAPVPIREADL